MEDILIAPERVAFLGPTCGGASVPSMISQCAAVTRCARATSAQHPQRWRWRLRPKGRGRYIVPGVPGSERETLQSQLCKIARKEPTFSRLAVAHGRLFSFAPQAAKGSRLMQQIAATCKNESARIESDRIVSFQELAIIRYARYIFARDLLPVR
jgi:hypothetical protein